MKIDIINEHSDSNQLEWFLFRRQIFPPTNHSEALTTVRVGFQINYKENTSWILIIHQLYNLGDDFTLAPLQPSFVPSQTEKEPETFQPLGKQTNVEIKNIN